MGAWGHLSFENDDAGDWVYDFESNGMTAIADIFATLREEAEDVMEASTCGMALAAAEVVVALRGRPAGDLPDDLLELLKGKPIPDDALVEQALQASQAILTDSELQALWEEVEDYPLWQGAVQNLIDRLRQC